jgi:hypothetical protein
VCKCILPPGDNPIGVNKYIIYLRLCLPNRFFSSRFHTTTLYVLLFFSIRTTPQTILDLTTRIILVSNTNHKAPHYEVLSNPQHPILEQSQIMFFSCAWDQYLFIRESPENITLLKDYSDRTQCVNLTILYLKALKLVVWNTKVNVPLYRKVLQISVSLISTQ